MAEDCSLVVHDHRTNLIDAKGVLNIGSHVFGEDMTDLAPRLLRNGLLNIQPLLPKQLEQIGKEPPKLLL